jgi:hypothetical protein
MSCRSRTSTLVVVLLAAGCGGGGAVAHAPPRGRAGPGPCARSVVAALGGHVRTHVTGYTPGAQATCVYETPSLRVEVMMDDFPQVPFRFERAVVESGQNAIWSHKPWKNPQLLHGIGGGADWFPGEHQLLTTGRHLLITITVVRPEHGRVALAERVAKATLASRALPGPGPTLR